MHMYTENRRNLNVFYLFVFGYAHMSAASHRGQRKALIPLTLKVQASVSHRTWMLGTGLGSSVRAECTLNHSAISLGPLKSVNMGRVSTHGCMYVWRPVMDLGVCLDYSVCLL